MSSDFYVFSLVILFFLKFINFIWFKIYIIFLKFSYDFYLFGVVYWPLTAMQNRQQNDIVNVPFARGVGLGDVRGG